LILRIQYTSDPDYDDGLRFSCYAEIWRVILTLSEAAFPKQVKE